MGAVFVIWTSMLWTWAARLTICVELAWDVDGGIMVGLIAGVQAVSTNATRVINVMTGAGLFHITDFLIFFIRASSFTGSDVDSFDYVPSKLEKTTEA
jgi:hypothetical protein